MIHQKEENNGVDSIVDFWAPLYVYPRLLVISLCLLGQFILLLFRINNESLLQLFDI